MVRTVAGGSLRVAAGGKAPKKGGSSYSNPPSPTESFGKDNCPVNKYFPRDTPAWQKKITFFISTKENEPKAEETPEIVKVPSEPSENGSRRSKRSSSVLDESDEMDATEVSVSTKKFKTNGVDATDDMEMDG